MINYPNSDDNINTLEVYYAVLICDFGSLINIHGMRRMTTAYKMSLVSFDEIVKSTSLEKKSNFLYSGVDPNRIYEDCVIFMNKVAEKNDKRNTKFPVKHFMICSYEELEYYDSSIIEYNIGNHNPGTIIVSREVKNMMRDFNNSQHHSFSYKGERIVYYIARNVKKSRQLNRNPYLGLLHESVYLACIKSSDPDITINTSQNHRFLVVAQINNIIVVITRHIDDIFRYINENSITFYMIERGDVIFDPTSNRFYGPIFDNCMMGFRIHSYNYEGIITDSCNYQIFRDFLGNMKISDPTTDERITSKIIYFINDPKIPNLGFDAKEKTVLNELINIKKMLYKIDKCITSGKYHSIDNYDHEEQDHNREEDILDVYETCNSEEVSFDFLIINDLNTDNVENTIQEELDKNVSDIAD